MKAQGKFSNLQLELLKLYSFELDESELEAVRDMLGKFLANKLIKNVDNARKANDITDEDLGRWLRDEDQ